jgi:hypothetical protein
MAFTLRASPPLRRSLSMRFLLHFACQCDSSLREMPLCASPPLRGSIASVKGNEKGNLR